MKNETSITNIFRPFQHPTRVCGCNSDRAQYSNNSPNQPHFSSTRTILMRLVSTLQPATRMQFGPGAVLQHFANPTPLSSTRTSTSTRTILMRLVRAGRRLDVFLGLKPQAESGCPFGVD
jgi:hypothetical protein